MSNIKTPNAALNRLSSENFRTAEKSGIYIILDNLRSGNNIGSIFRTADAFRIKKIFISGNSAVPPNKEILKTALGATDSVEWEYIDDVLNMIVVMKNSGINVYSVEQVSGSIPLNELTISDSNEIALVFGNEVDGVQQNIIDNCTACIEIPQFGTKHSLNVAVSSGIVLWHIMNQILQKNQKT